MIPNNNKKIIGKLANRSVRSNRTRNIFILITIALSVSLLGGMSLFQSAREEKINKRIGEVQHVIYGDVNEIQIEQLRNMEEMDFLTLTKFGSSFKLENKMIIPVYFEKDTRTIKTKAIAEGNYPEMVNEIVVDRPMLKLFPDVKDIGDSIKIKFLDGSEEDFIISGFYEEIDEHSKVYSILFSKEYSEHGEQLKDVPYDIACKIKNADRMSKVQFLDIVRKMGKDAGVEMESIVPNDFFANSLTPSRQEILLIIGISVGVLFASLLVVYNIFYISVLENVQRFGQLRTIGTSRKQIKSIVRREGAMMFVMGTPIGLLISWIVSYWVIPEGWNWRNTIILSLIIAIIEFITIIISVQRPANIASSISAVEASKFSGYKSKGLKEAKELHRKLSPHSMAGISLRRNRNKSFLTQISLGIGGTLFLVSATLVVSTSLEEYSRHGMYQLGEYIISLDYNTVQTIDKGVIGVQLKNPINEELVERIKSIPEIDKITEYHRTSVKFDYKDAVNVKDSFSAFSRGDIDAINKTLSEGTFDYDEMIKNDEILVAHNKIVKEIYGWKFEIGDKVNFRYFDGNKEIEKALKVIGSIDKSSNVTYNSGWFILPIEKLEQLFPGINTIDTLVISINDFEKKEERVELSLHNLIDENPLLEMNTLKEKLMENKHTFDLMNKGLVGLSGFIILFSLISLVNTIITNIISRKKEFAMLQSIGLSNKQLIRMIQFEGLGLSFGNLIITLIFGTTLGYGLIRVLQYFGATYIHYHFPIGYLMIYILTIVMIPVVVSRISVRIFQKESLVSRLRNIG